MRGVIEVSCTPSVVLLALDTPLGSSFDEAVMVEEIPGDFENVGIGFKVLVSVVIDVVVVMVCIFVVDFEFDDVTALSDGGDNVSEFRLITNMLVGHCVEAAGISNSSQARCYVCYASFAQDLGLGFRFKFA